VAQYLGTVISNTNPKPNTNPNPNLILTNQSLTFDYPDFDCPGIVRVPLLISI